MLDFQSFPLTVQELFSLIDFFGNLQTARSRRHNKVNQRECNRTRRRFERKVFGPSQLLICQINDREEWNRRVRQGESNRGSGLLSLWDIFLCFHLLQLLCYFLLLTFISIHYHWLLHLFTIIAHPRCRGVISSFNCRFPSGAI